MGSTYLVDLIGVVLNRCPLWKLAGRPNHRSELRKSRNHWEVTASTGYAFICLAETATVLLRQIASFEEPWIWLIGGTWWPERRAEWEIAMGVTYCGLNSQGYGLR